MAHHNPSSAGIVVIGAGLGGMAAAMRLVAQGHTVTVCESGATLGGRARSVSDQGFTWDAGPTVLTAPHMLESLFSDAGLDLSNQLELVPVDPYYRVFSPSGRTLDYFGDVDRLVTACETASPGSGPGVRTLVARTRSIFTAFHPYTERHMMDLRAMVGMLPYMLRHRAFRSVRGLVRSCVRDPFLRSALEFHPLLVGGNPARTPSLYALITEFERRWGVHYAVGGTSSLVQAMESALVELGVDVRVNCAVSAIVSQQGSVSGVRTATGELIPASIVVANIDPVHARLLITPAHRRLGRVIERARWATRRSSMSLHVVYLGLDRLWPESDLAHHSILLPQDAKRGLRMVFGRKSKSVPTANDRFMYVHLPSVTDPSAAPAGCTSLYALVAARPLRGSESPESAETIRADVLARLEPHLPGIADAIVAQRHIGPSYFRDELGSPAGEAFSQQPTLLQSAWFRPHTRQRRPRGLYLVGAGTHPGAGVPAVLASAHIAADLISADLGRRQS